MAINILFPSALRAGNPRAPGQPGSFRLRPVYLCLLCSLTATALPTSAREYFNPAFLMGADGKHSHVDLSAYENAGYVAPGRYLVDVYMNQHKVDNREIEFRRVNGHLQPVLTVAQLEGYGVNILGLPAFKGKASDSTITDLTKQIPHARATLDFAHLRLDLSLPQAAMQPHHSGMVDPSLWDNGIPAFLMNYTVNGSEGRYDNQGSGGSHSRNLFASFRNGLNLGPWRLRSTQTYSYNRQRNEGAPGFSTPAQTQWQVSNTYLQRDVQSLRSEFTAGETYTGGDIFDSIPFRGMKLASEETMLPDSQRGFAPVVTGVANSNAQVTVSQHGNIVYQTTVAPGPFRFTDLYTTGSTGDLTITVKEEDGRTRVSTLASSSVPMMLRPGGVKYELTTGQYHGGNLTNGSRSPVFALGTLVYGLPHNITLYGGGLVAGNYQSGVLGSGVSLGAFGALSADVTLARAQLQGNQDQEERGQFGQSYRVKYSKNLLSTGTGIDLAAYRYSTQHYYSFSDANSMGYSLNNDYQVPWALDRRQNTWQVNLRQTLGRWGSLYASGTRNDYWNGRADNNLSLGYNAMLMGISYNLSYHVSRIKGEGHWPENRQVSFNMQVPLSLFGSSPALRGVYTRYTASRDSQGNLSQQTGINGMLWDNRLSYNLQQGWGHSGQQNSRALSLGYQGSQGSVNLGYNDNADSRHVTYGTSGALLIHPYGITLSRALGDTAVLVRAPGAKGVTVSNGNVQTDWRGYAVLAGGSVYHKNTINLDPSTLPEGVDIDQTSRNVYPTKGAVTLANYQVRLGSQLLLTLTHHGKPVPFGATATLAGNATQAGSGIVGDNGRVYLSGMPSAGHVKVKWGNGADQQCTTRYQVSSDTPGQLVQANAVCL
ncbi:fimbria/pilus outer membrane usher protein [Photorhabdus sp. RM323S]|uniref:fimbria/pilus outer membrane usher protein n=1 Tax=Photorhabdus sp. RM323S TaxID=3342828 RepID=UPI0036D7D6E5